MSTRKHDRADGQTSLSISLSEPLKQRIAEVAKSENRTISNWFCTHIGKLLEDASTRFSMQETPNSGAADHQVNTPAKTKKYLTAAEQKKASAGAKTLNASESFASGSSIVGQGNSQKVG